MAGSTSENIDVEDTIASVRKTLASLDDFERKWKDVQTRFADTLRVSLQSAFGVESACTLSEEEKHSVLQGRPNIEQLCKKLKCGDYTKIIVMTGAGISVSAGIPDFRSPGSGLYETLDLKKYDLPTVQAVFDIEFFKKNPTPFFKVAKELFYKGKFSPTPAHHFIKLLADRGLLLRCYSQNIDGLELQAGVPEDLLVEAHGSINSAFCINPSCKEQHDSERVRADILADQIPMCDKCKTGIVKPNIVFFGEDLPMRFKSNLEPDFNECDLLIIMGTSLKVQPFCGLIHRVKSTIPRLLINKERVGTFTLEAEGGYRDVAMLEDCDGAVRKICKLCAWDDGKTESDATSNQRHHNKNRPKATSVARPQPHTKTTKGSNTKPTAQ